MGKLLGVLFTFATFAACSTVRDCDNSTVCNDDPMYRACKSAARGIANYASKGTHTSTTSFGTHSEVIRDNKEGFSDSKQDWRTASILAIRSPILPDEAHCGMAAWPEKADSISIIHMVMVIIPVSGGQYSAAFSPSPALYCPGAPSQEPSDGHVRPRHRAGRASNVFPRPVRAEGPPLPACGSARRSRNGQVHQDSRPRA